MLRFLLISVVFCLQGAGLCHAGNPDTMGLYRRTAALHGSIAASGPVRPDVSRSLINQGLATQGIDRNPVLKLQLLVDLGAWCKNAGELDSCIALGYSNAAAARGLGNDSLGILARSDMAVAYFRKGLSDSAMKYQLICLGMAEAAGNTRETVRAFYFLGAIHNSLGNAASALGYYTKCHEAAKRSGDAFLIAYSHDGLAFYHQANGSYATAAGHYLEALAIYKRLNKKMNEARCYNNLSSVYDLLGQPAQSLEYGHRALELFESLGSRNDVLLCNLALGETLINNGRHREALPYCLKAEALALDLHTPGNLQPVYNCLSEIYRQQGNSTMALEYYQKYTAVKDSLLGIENLNYISELEKKYQVEKKELRIVSLTQENKLKKAESDLHRRRSSLWLTAACLLLVISLLIYFIFRQRARSARQLAEKNEQLYRRKINEIIKEQELKSISGIMEGQENERKRIAEDLHDRLGSMLATIKLHFNAVELKIESLELKSLEQYQKANRLLDQVCDEVRKIAHNMESGVLVNFGLVHALTDLKEALAQSSGLSIAISSFGMKERLGTETEITVYRVIQELLSNVIKHAKATEVSIDLNRTSEKLTVVFSDNGQGYDADNSPGREGMGLKNIRSRILKLRGKFYVDSGSKSGTTNIIEIPLEHQHPDS